MEEDNVIRCLRHCTNDYNIFYVNFPEICPICRGKMIGSFLVLPPFCIPYPFVSSLHRKYSAIVKPTDGCFLKTYESGDDLHIGLTSSTGLVINYDDTGVHIDDPSKWRMCIAVDLLDIFKRRSSSVKMILSKWDETLFNYGNEHKWSREKYSPTAHNCYDFVLSFLNDICGLQFQDFQNKATFCTTHILPKTIKAAQYIDLYRRITENGIFVRKTAHQIEGKGYVT